MPFRVRLVVVMDPIEAIKPAKDSTLAILLAAQARGWDLFYAEQKDLYLRDGVAFGRLAPLKVFEDPKAWFTRGGAEPGRLGDYDVILMRKDPPVDTEPVHFARQRMPDADDHRGNLAAGARAESRPLNDRDRWLCSVIGPKLKAAGMIFVGLDVIGDFVTEINVTSPTGIRELDKKHGVDVGGMLVSAISRSLSEYST